MSSTEVLISLGPDFSGAPRPDKGKSKLIATESYISIDIETTGFDPRFDSLIEFGAVKMKDGLVIDQFQSLVKPESDIPSYITELTGISNDMVANAPFVEDVLPQFLAFIGDNLLVGHNVNFDINFIYDLTRFYTLPPLSNDFVDTLRLSRRLFSDWTNYKLETMANYFQIGEVTAHRALSDSLKTAQCYEQIKKYIRENDIQLKSFTSWNSLSKHITSQTDTFDPDSPIFGKSFAFTGALEKMHRRDAMQLVVNAGGVCCDGVTRDTNYLVLGSTDYCKSIKDGKSSKQKRAEALRLAGYDISIIS